MRDNCATVDPRLRRTQADSSGTFTHGSPIPCATAERNIFGDIAFDVCESAQKH